MLTRVDETARRVIDAYATASFGDRLHTRVRWRVCPFPHVEAELPSQGEILDLGCGHGVGTLDAALRSPDRRMLGVDIDAHKLVAARAAAARLGIEDRVRFVDAAPGDLPAGPFDAVVMVDVAYLLTAPARAALLAELRARVAPGGVIVCKDTGRQPRAKYALGWLEEVAATRILRITQGTAIDMPSASELETALRAEGWSCASRRIDAGYPHAHFLTVARRR